MVSFSVGVLVKGALLLGVHIRVPQFLEAPIWGGLAKISKFTWLWGTPSSTPGVRRMCGYVSSVVQGISSGF